MRFWILGPIEITDGRDALSLGARKQRIVLAKLICSGNEIVSAERLVDAVWEDNPPKTARKNLQVYVYHLRRLLGDKHRITRHKDGYRLNIDPAELDAEEFEQIVAQARQASSAGRTEDA